jgi:predicted permease
MPILHGREFRESDDETAPLVAIVNRTMASRFWPGQDPIGKRFSFGKTNGPFWEVVGVAHDSKYVVVFEGSLPYFYVPLAQHYHSRRALQIRSSLPPESLGARVQREIKALDPDMPISDMRTMRQTLTGATGSMLFQVGAYQAGALGILGLVLAVIGVYGVVSYAASQRTREIGIRIALGADQRDVLSLVLVQGVRLVVVGVLAGLAATMMATRVIGVFLYVSATDPLTFTAVTLLLAAIALWACYLPARRAMRVDPMVALRHE